MKNLPASVGGAGDTGGAGSIPGQEDPLENEIVSHSRIPAWKIPWAGEPGGLPSLESKELATTERLRTHTQIQAENI